MTIDLNKIIYQEKKNTFGAILDASFLTSSMRKINSVKANGANQNLYGMVLVSNMYCKTGICTTITAKIKEKNIPMNKATF